MTILEIYTTVKFIIKTRLSADKRNLTMIISTTHANNLHIVIVQHFVSTTLKPNILINREGLIIVLDAVVLRSSGREHHKCSAGVTLCNYD